MFAQANSEHCRHKIFNATWTIDGEPQPQSLFAMIRATHAANPHGTLVAYSDNSSVIEGAVVERFHRRRRWPVCRASRGDAHPDEGGDAQSSDGDRAVSGCRDRRGRRDPRRRCDRHRREAEGRARRLHDVAPAARVAAAAVGDRLRQARAHRVGAVDHAGRRRSARRRSTTSSGGRTSPAISARSSSEVAGEMRGYHKPIMIAGGVGNIARRAYAQAAARRRRAADPARRPGHADRHGRRRGVVDGDRRQHGRPRLRFGAARQRGDRAARAGSDRPLLAARRAQSDPVDPRRRRGRTCRTRCRSSCTAAASAARSSFARSRPRNPA